MKGKIMRSEPRYVVKAFGLLLLVIGWNAAATSLGQDSGTGVTENHKPSATIACRVVDDKGDPLAGADVVVLKWTGSYDSFGVSATTNAEGEVELTFAYSDDSFYLLFSADGYASSMHSLQINTGESQRVDFQLSPAVRPWIEVTADGLPRAGAEVSMIDFTDRNGGKVYLMKSTAKVLGYEFPQSDASGRLTLPSLPADAKFNLWVVHPARKTAKLQELVATDEKLANIELESGVPVTLELSAELEELSGLDGQMASVMMLTASGGSTAPETVRHEFPIRDGKIRFTAYPTKYSEMQFQIQEYFPTPYLINYPKYPMPELDLSDAEPAEFKIKLRRKVKVRGRVVDVQGEGVADAFVTSSIANHRDPSAGSTNEASDQDEDSTPPTDAAWESLRNWSSGGSGQTDAEGHYEIDVALGPIKLEVIREGYFSSPVVTEAATMNTHSLRMDKIEMIYCELRDQAQ